MSEKKYLTLSEILHSNEPVDLYIDSLDVWVKIKNASTKDRIEAEKLAMKHPSWNEMDQNDRSREIGRMLALQLLVEPKITYEDYLKCDDITIQTILSSVSSAYLEKIIALSDKQGKIIKSFLQQVKDKDLLNSLTSSKLETLNGNKQQ